MPDIALPGDAWTPASSARAPTTTRCRGRASPRCRTRSYGNFAPLLPQLRSAARRARRQGQGVPVVVARTWRSSASERAKKSVSLNEAERRAERDKLETPSASSARPSARRWAWPWIRWPTTQPTTACRPSERDIAKDAAREKRPRSARTRCCANRPRSSPTRSTCSTSDRKLSAQVLPASTHAGALGGVTLTPRGVPDARQQESDSGRLRAPVTLWAMDDASAPASDPRDKLERARALLDAGEPTLDELARRRRPQRLAPAAPASPRASASARPNTSRSASSAR